MATTNMPTPSGVCREIPVLIEPVISPFSVPVRFPAVKDAARTRGLGADACARRARWRVLVVVVVDQPLVAEAAHRVDDRQQRGALVRVSSYSTRGGDSG